MKGMGEERKSSYINAPPVFQSHCYRPVDHDFLRVFSEREDLGWGVQPRGYYCPHSFSELSDGWGGEGVSLASYFLSFIRSFCFASLCFALLCFARSSGKRK
jgi:hypothetical protein